MKKLLFIIAAGFLSLSAMDDLPLKVKVGFCAELKDGVLQVRNSGNLITNEITLDNGTTVQTNGTVIAKDGSRFILSDGDCIDSEGNLIDEDPESIISEPKQN